MRIVNLTPHALCIHTGEVVHRIEPSGTVARCLNDIAEIGKVPGTDIPLTTEEPGQVINIPPPQEGVVYVASRLVAIEVDRRDVLAPGPLIRNAQGQPIGCRGLSKPA